MDKTFLEVQKSNIFSMEFFPAKNDDHEKLLHVVQAYQALGLNSINITCTAQKVDRTIAKVKLIREHTDLTITPHIVAKYMSKADLERVLQVYSDLQINNLLVIRGDDAPIEHAHKVDFKYAVDLVRQIKLWAPNISIGVAGYPELHFQTENAIQDMVYLKEKVDAGADYIITQLFFDNRDFYRFVDRCRIFDITIPIIPGLAYIKNKEHICKLVHLAQRAQIPNELLQKVYMENDESFGAQWLERQVDDLIAHHISHIHMYTFNDLGPFPHIIKKHSGNTA